MSGGVVTLTHTPLAALPTAALDLETTGLLVKRDRVVQVAVVAMLGTRILDAPRIDRLVDPGMPIPEASTRIHGLADSDVAGAARFADIADSLREALAGRVVVGHNIAFDLAILRHEAKRAGIAWHEPQWLDVAMLAGALAPALPDLGLETIAKHLGVTVTGRHSALGDAMAAAEIFACLIHLLREKDVRTLGEAQAFAARRDDLLRRQVEQGWHAQTSPIQGQEQPSFRVDSYAFQRRLGELMSAPPIFTTRRATLREAAATMVERRIGALLIGDGRMPPEGIVTERDLLRVTAQGAADLDRMTVAEIMSVPVECMGRGELLYRALARMDRLGVRHLCVADDQGIAVGMVSQRDLLQHRARAATVIDDALAEANSVQSLAAAYGRVPRAAAQLSAEGLDGVEIGRVVSAELRALSARSVSFALERMADEGLGGAPAPWCFVLLGSAGRGESLLGADQDNALIHAGAGSDDPWFAALGARVSDYLDEAGVPRCKGGVMAANAPWRGTSAAWRQRVGDWLRRARPEDLINVDIFFDLVPVAGDPALGRTLHQDAVRDASLHPTFLALLAASVQSYTPRFGLFGRLAVDQGRADLKRDGLLPMVAFARALALRVGSTARPTPERIMDVLGAGRLGEQDAAMLIETHGVLMSHILRQQLADLAEGIAPSNRVALKTLSRDERDDLHRRLHSLDIVVRDIRTMMTH
ncbi:MAG: CBS domain-containing protein [Alphaproteobacteria bacterium]|nr:CBS domain-containing protein [Alphaproteobacteria bacterium]